MLKSRRLVRAFLASMSWPKVVEEKGESISSQDQDHPVCWEIEAIKIEGRICYICGWLFHPLMECRKIFLDLQSRKGSSNGSIELERGQPRPDVSLVHGLGPWTSHSGFIGIGSWKREPLPSDNLILRCEFSDGSTLRLPIREDLWHKPDLRTNSWFSHFRQRTRSLRHYGRKMAGLIARGQFEALREKVVRQLSDRPKKDLLNTEKLSHLIQPTGKETVHLVVDHRLGGGANQYRERLISDWLHAGESVLILSFMVSELRYIVIIRRAEESQSFYLNSGTDLLEMLHDIRLSDITYNTAVSFSYPEMIPGVLASLKDQCGGKLILLLHDYFMICPSNFLLNSDREFCGIPDPDICRNCLPNNPQGFSSLFQDDIVSWRQSWSQVVRLADKIIAFSESSAQLFRKAYGEIMQQKALEVIPHSVSYLETSPILIDDNPPFIIGIVGQIGFHKGAEVVRNLAAEIKQSGGEERICIIGTLESTADPSIVRETGPYRHGDLAGVIQKSKASLMLVPSIWPETFSYVTEELIQLGLPVACFDMGAPAERIRKYRKGCILPSQHPADILKSLHSFFDSIYSDAHTIT